MSICETPLVLSLFPGLDLFGKAFSEHGFSVVRGPDILLGDDIRTFHVPAGRFDGVIAGPPCQEFSALNRRPNLAAGSEMLQEFARVVSEAAPDWWLMENVVGVPDLQISDYGWQRFNLDLAWFTDCSRLRTFQFGHKSERPLDISEIKPKSKPLYSAVLASDNRSFATMKGLQGLPNDFDLPAFNAQGKRQAVGNGVPMALGRYLADVIKRQVYGIDSEPTIHPDDQRYCGCKCGRPVWGNQVYAGASCRKRAQRRRDRAPSLIRVSRESQCDVPGESHCDLPGDAIVTRRRVDM